MDKSLLEQVWDMRIEIDDFYANNGKYDPVLKAIETIKIRRIEQRYKYVLCWINAIPDSRTREIFKLKYVDNLTWPQIHKKFKCKYSPDTLRWKRDEYLKKSRKTSFSPV